MNMSQFKTGVKGKKQRTGLLPMQAFPFYYVLGDMLIDNMIHDTE